MADRYEDPFRDPSGVRGFCSRNESLDYKAFPAVPTPLKRKKKAHKLFQHKLFGPHPKDPSVLKIVRRSNP